MKEHLITTRKARAEDGRSLTLRYFLLTRGPARGAENYGVRVNEQRSNSNALAPDLTADAQRAFQLIDTLAKGAVTPTGLMDVLADWL